jgi:drug/metabolite transporter (DMT)-like permease
MSAASNHRWGVLLVAGAALWWSTGGLFIRAVHTDPWTTIFWRSVFAFATMFLFIAIRKRARTLAHVRAIGWPGVLLGLCFCGASSAYVPAVILTSVANTLILQSLAPFVAALLGFLVLRERINLRTGIAMLITSFGVYIMVAGAIGGGSSLGNLLGFTIALCYGGGVVVTRHHRNVQMLPASCLATVFSALLSISILTLSHRSPLEVSPRDLLYLAGFGAFQMAGGMVLFTYGVRLIPAAESALLSIVESIAAPIWVFAFFGEKPGYQTLFGGAIVLGTLLVYTSLDLRRRTRSGLTRLRASRDLAQIRRPSAGRWSPRASRDGSH